MAIAPLLVMLLISLPLKTLPQAPTIENCTPRLLPLTPCAPFVQGLAQTPPPSCCDNLDQLYQHQPGCLCLLLNNTNSSPFPINTTLAMQLPPLCHIQLHTSVCPGGPQVPIGSPTSQVSLGAHSNSSTGSPTKSSDTSNNSTVAASPMVQVAPRPVGLGLSHNASIKLQGSEGILMLVFSLSMTLFYLHKEFIGPN